MALSLIERAMGAFALQPNAATMDAVPHVGAERGREPPAAQVGPTRAHHMEDQLDAIEHARR